MNLSSSTSESSESRPGPIPVARQKGLVVFCEKNLRYEGGLKAWVFLGPYFVGAFILEIVIETNPAHAQAAVGPWIGFLAYLILFPTVWRRVLKFVVPTSFEKERAALPSDPSFTKQTQG